MSALSLHHGDCIDILKSFAADSIDLVLTDPPYVCRYRDGTGRTVANDNRSDWIAPAFREIARVMRPDTLCISFYGWTAVEHFIHAWRAAGLAPVGHIVWPKEYASSRGFLAARHEQAFLLAKGHPPKPGNPPSDVQRWRYSGNPLHPTQKDVRILEPLIAAFSKPGDLVLDPFMGSGSTGAAAATNKRRFVGIELERQHYDTAAHRLRHAFPSYPTAWGMAA
ncbi:MAG: DNA methyltransferase [Acetobacteraceae bacterium]